MSLCLISTAALNSLGLPHLLKQNTIRGKQKISLTVLICISGEICIYEYTFMCIEFTYHLWPFSLYMRKSDRCDRDHNSKTENIYYLAIFRKSLPTQYLSISISHVQNSWSLDISKISRHRDKKVTQNVHIGSTPHPLWHTYSCKN